jgi:hypothetical protein
VFLRHSQLCYSKDDKYLLQCTWLSLSISTSHTVNKAVNCANKRNPILVNEVLVINFPSTGNAQLQSPNTVELGYNVIKGT